MPFLDDQAGLTNSDNQRLNSTGFITMYGGGPPVPSGWLFCDGSAVSRALYANLFAVIGTTFGAGDGTTTFNIPDFSSRSPIGAGQGSGLSLYAVGDEVGEENHVLTEAELATHTHLQNSHNHTQDAHNHLQDAHGHSVTDPGHNHTQDSHNHTQNAHSHGVTDPGHLHTDGEVANVTLSGSGTNIQRTDGNTHTTDSATTGITIDSQTATNQSATATNQSATTGVTIGNTTATNQSTTATNQATTATNQNTGSSQGHNTIHPVLAVNFIIKT